MHAFSTKRAAGFVPEEQETVVIAALADLDLAVAPPDGVVIREVQARSDLERIAELEAIVWNEESPTRADALDQELAADPDAMRIFVAEAGENDAGLVHGVGSGLGTSG